MKPEQTQQVFGHDVASDYDAKREKLVDIKNALHLCLRALATKLPEKSCVLIVGAGTGAELIYLAQAFPHWRFVIVEPSSAMMDVCRQRANQCEITNRCTFHEAYLDNLTIPVEFDLATSILVSHFFNDDDQRKEFYASIASRLRSGALFVEATLASDIMTSDYRQLLDVWINMHQYAGIPFKAESFTNKVLISSEKHIKELIACGGFNTPVRFFQTLFIHAWFATKN